MEYNLGSISVIREGSKDLFIFDQLIEYLSHYRYGKSDFLRKCRNTGRNLDQCSLIWDSLVEVARNWVRNYQKNIIDSIRWLIEIAFPISGSITLESRRSEEYVRNQMYQYFSQYIVSRGLYIF